MRVGDRASKRTWHFTHPVGPATAFAVVLYDVGHPGVSKLQCHL